ncbi:MAG: acyl--CoA ligase [Ramlibacter sp.]|nr:acyl--CoA ligase [Ramlibacter sp.]
MNLLEPIQRQVRAHPDRPAIVSDGTTLTYRELWTRVRQVAARLHDEGIRRGDCVAVSGLIPRGRVVLLLALARIGASSIAIQTSMPRATRELLFAQSNSVAWVAREEFDQEGAAPRRIAAESLFNTVSSLKPPAQESGLQDAVWRIALSSGTTGANKCIPWTHGEIAHSQQLSMATYPGGPRERLMIVVDLNLNYALVHALRQLSAGGAVIFPTTLDPTDVVESIQRDRPTRMVSTPSVIGALATHLASLPQAIEFDSLLSVMLGGGVVVPKLRVQLERRLCPDIIVIYGSTEMASVARADSAIALEYPASTGRLMPWIEAQAQDEQGQLLPPGQIGTLRFRAPAMARGYLGNPEATAAAFRDGWFCPGDKGSIDATGILTLGGRTDDVLNLNGLKIDPATVESVLDSHEAVHESAVTAVRDGRGRDILALLVVAEHALSAADQESICEQLYEAIGVRYPHIRVVPVSELPRTPVGKLARSKLPALAVQTQVSTT